MKIAVLFAGQLRTFKECAPKIKQYLLNELPGEVDVFAHFWPNESEAEISKFKDIYKPVQIDRTKQPPKEFYGKDYPGMKIGIGSGTGGTIIQEQTMQYNLQCQWYAIQCAFKCMKNYVKEKNLPNYDIVVRCRPDCIYKSKVGVPKDLKENVIYVGPNHRVPVRGRPTNVNNVFALGSQKAMEVYCLYFDDVRTVLKEVESLPKNDPDALIKTNYSLNSYFVYYCTSMKGMNFTELKHFPSFLYRKGGKLVPMRP